MEHSNSVQPFTQLQSPVTLRNDSLGSQAIVPATWNQYPLHLSADQRSTFNNQFHSVVVQALKGGVAPSSFLNLSQDRLCPVIKVLDQDFRKKQRKYQKMLNKTTERDVNTITQLQSHQLWLMFVHTGRQAFFIRWLISLFRTVTDSSTHRFSALSQIYALEKQRLKDAKKSLTGMGIKLCQDIKDLQQKNQLDQQKIEEITQIYKTYVFLFQTDLIVNNEKIENFVNNLQNGGQ